MESTFKANAWRALATFPVPPPSFLDRMWEAALGSAKNERALAQVALKHAPNRESRLAAALASGQQEQRSIAADWTGRLGLTALVPVLRTAIAKEKHDTPKAAMIGAVTILTDPIFQGLAISLLFGLASSTMLTVLVIPAIYIVFRQKTHDAAI